MEAVISVDVAQELGALFAVEVEDVHRFVTHAQEHGDELRLGVGKKIRMSGTCCNETPRAEVEKLVALRIVHIGRNPEEEGETHQENKVEV